MTDPVRPKTESTGAVIAAASHQAGTHHDEVSIFPAVPSASRERFPPAER